MLTARGVRVSWRHRGSWCACWTWSSRLVVCTLFKRIKCGGVYFLTILNASSNKNSLIFFSVFKIRLNVVNCDFWLFLIARERETKLAKIFATSKKESKKIWSHCSALLIYLLIHNQELTYFQYLPLTRDNNITRILLWIFAYLPILPYVTRTHHVKLPHLFDFLGRAQNPFFSFVNLNKWTTSSSIVKTKQKDFIIL